MQSLQLTSPDCRSHENRRYVEWLGKFGALAVKEKTGCVSEEFGLRSLGCRV